MKGKITCPNCEHNFVTEFKEEKEKFIVSCPNCNHNFNIKIKCRDKNLEECTWEEHGEPRKTVLSSIKPKSNKPVIATIILVVVFALGVSTSVFSEVFISSTLDVFSYGGVTGTAEFEIIGPDNNSIDNATVYLNDEKIMQNSEGIYKKDNVELGIQDLIIEKQDFRTKKTEIIILPFVSSKSTFQLENSSGSIDKTYFDTFGCSLILAIFTVFSLFAIITCLKREHFDVAIAGSLLGAFSFGFFFIGTVLSIIAFIFIWKSKDEFKNGEKGKIF